MGKPQGGHHQLRRRYPPTDKIHEAQAALRRLSTKSQARPMSVVLDDELYLDRVAVLLLTGPNIFR